MPSCRGRNQASSSGRTRSAGSREHRVVPAPTSSFGLCRCGPQPAGRSRSPRRAEWLRCSPDFPRLRAVGGRLPPHGEVRRLAVCLEGRLVVIHLTQQIVVWGGVVPEDVEAPRADRTAPDSRRWPACARRDGFHQCSTDRAPSARAPVLESQEQAGRAWLDRSHWRRPRAPAASHRRRPVTLDLGLDTRLPTC